MPWPKGKPRKGYVKSGAIGLPAPKVIPKLRKVVQVSASVFTKTAPTETHGDRLGRAVIETCPNCHYAYADGGHCPLSDGGCGWTAYTVIVPAGSTTGRKWK